MSPALRGLISYGSVFPQASSYACKTSNTLYPIPVPRLYASTPLELNTLPTAFK